MTNVMFIAPHADDEVLGCGATIARLAKQGCNVYVLIATNASVGAPELFSADQVKKIRIEALAAHKMLGVKETLFLELPAPALDQYPVYKIAGQLSDVIVEKNIDAIFIPHRGDCHCDHLAIHNAAMVASRPRKGCPVKCVYAYETLSETEWGEPVGSQAFVPTLFYGFTEQEFDLKLQALSSFASQIQPFPASRSLEAVEALGKLRGATVGAMRAEAFEVLREIR